jgi:hypothetical protein
MGAFAGPNISENSLVLALDAANKKSYSQNEFQYSTDIFGWCSSSAVNAATISRDTISSPVGNTPLKMVVTGNDPHIQTYNSADWNIAPAANGQRWVVSVYVKANVATTGEIIIFGANSSGKSLVSGAWLAISGTTVNITTEWTRVSYYIDMANASIAYIHTRLDGPDTGGTGQTVWWDGLQVERVPAGTTTPTPFTSAYYGGSVFKDLVGSNNGTLVNYPTYSSANFGSIVFDGTDDYAPIGTTGFPFGSSAGTLSAWAKTNTITGGYLWIVSYGTANTSQARFLGILNSTYLFGGFGGTPDITASGVPLNTWFNMVGVYDGTNASIYINGVLVSGPTAKTWNTVANNAQIGRQVNGIEYWNGNIAQTTIYNRALSAQEIQQNFNATRSRFGI